MKLGMVVKYLVVWQVLMILVTLVVAKYIPLKDTYLGGGKSIYQSLSVLFSRANFDGNNYIAISKKGYTHPKYDFFPLYPLLIHQVAQIVDPSDTWYFQISTVVAVTISLVSFTLGVMVLMRLIELDYSKNVSRLTLVILLVFPASFYFSAVYSEGLLFLLLISSFYFARTKRWWLAGLMAGLASYTEFVGILLFPALLAELWQQGKLTKLKQVFPVLLAPLGLLTYMFFLQKITGDWTAFLHVPTSPGIFSGDEITLLYQVFWRYAKMIFLSNPLSLIYVNVIFEAVVGASFFVLSIISFARQRLSYALFSFLAFIAPTLTGSFVSLPRYVLVCFPLFILMSEYFVKRPKWARLYLFISAILLIIFLSMFSRGYWVA